MRIHIAESFYAAVGGDSTGAPCGELFETIRVEKLPHLKPKTPELSSVILTPRYMPKTGNDKLYVCTNTAYVSTFCHVFDNGNLSTVKVSLKHTRIQILRGVTRWYYGAL